MATSLESAQQAKAKADQIKAQADAVKAKVAEQQAKILEAKAKLDAVIAKFEKAKALQQSVSAAYKAGGVKGGLAALVASQVGSIRGKLVVEVNKRMDEALAKFINKCPTEAELQRIIKTKNNLKKNVSSFQSRVNSFQPVASSIETAVSAIQVLLSILTSIPLPTAIIPPTTGGIGIPISILTKYSNAIAKSNIQLVELGNQAKAVTSIVDSVSGVVTSVNNKLDSIDAYIERCQLSNAANSPNLDQIDNLIKNLQPPTQQIGGAGGTSETYKGYTLLIIQDPNSPTIAPKRYAVAKDRQGVTVLYGPSSFSADTQILLDELRFRIDNKLA